MWVNFNPKVDILSQNLNLGPHNYKQDTLPLNHTHHTVEETLFFTDDADA